MEARPRPLLLVVLDGFGVSPDRHANAILAARMPAWDALLARWPHSLLGASGEDVGLPAGQMGNSEVGHLNLGAGRRVLQDLPRIDRAIEDGSFFSNDALVAAARHAAAGKRLHLVGLVGPGGVHANDRHIVAITRLAASLGATDVALHALLDGRDTPPRSAGAFIPDLETRLREAHPAARIATVGGRYFAMDRDRRWERTRRGYDAIVHGRGLRAASATAAVATAYARGEGDEFVQPTVVDDGDGTVRDGDALIHCNFRADRARQLVHALVDRTFEGFERGDAPRGLLMVTMTEYEKGLPVRVAFPPERILALAEAISSWGWRQFHVAETEKYAHVTYFFNGGVERAWPGEDRLLVPSPKVATYDLMPEMSAAGITDALVEALRGDQYDFIVANYANPDMVGHTGVWEAAVRALETVDECLGRVVGAFEAVDGQRAAVGGAVMAVTADHGNVDELRDPDGRPVTAHSLNPVPLVIAGSPLIGRALGDGILADVAPTILELLGRSPLPGMTGRSLLR
ncbi:MAG TPA: 2,3-bisphosphoglycerate-independent phosphoglycerate mutase [Candidatus Limnocylindrales bacterium]|nr:2,3-bisphosphoglycerate-independent phosphoglycerate mutase [Candidatus Limnocylindrales bacterium]